jgi:hypothetical protein
MKTEAKGDTEYPTVFDFTIGSWMESQQLEWTGGCLVHRPSRGASPICVTLSASAGDWRRFWAAVEAANVWQWQKYYDNPSILDGTQWCLEISRLGRHVASGGSNAYPGSDGPGYPRTCEFAKFLKAVQNLTGQKF